MAQCAGCGRPFTPRNSRHRFCSADCRRHPVWGHNRRALETSLRALEPGREHDALVEACRSLADVVDRDPSFDDKKWREYRLALKSLREAITHGGSDPFDEFLDSLRTEVRDPTDTKP